MMRGALAMLLGLEPDLEVVAQVGRGDAVVPAALRARPDVALLDIELPGGNGIDAAGPVEALADAVRAVVAGRTVVEPELATSALAAGASPLTERECDVLTAAEDRSTVTDIAGRLHLSQSTVRNYLSSAIGKTETRNRIEAARAARDRGWL